MKQYELAVFDLDGTLLDTTQGILTSVSHLVEQMKLPQLPKEQQLTFIGPPIQYSLAKYYGLEEEKLREATAIFRNHYSASSLFLAEPYQGVYEALEHLRSKHVTLAVATYKREDYALRLLKHFKFDAYFDFMYGADNENKLKKKDIICKCIASAGVTDSRKVVVVGDTMHDALGAQQLRLDFIAVTYGFGFRKAEQTPEANAVAWIDTPIELVNLFTTKE